MQEEHSSSVENSQVDVGAQMGVTHEVATHETVSHEQQPQVSQNEINWRQANEALSQMKDEKARLAGELQALKSYIAQSQQPQQAQKSYFDGRERDDYANIHDVEAYVNNALGAKTQEFKATIEQLQLQAKDPHYKSVIEKYQQHLSPAMKDLILRSENPWTTAYEAVTNSAAYYRDQISSQQHPDARKILDNSRKPQTVSGVSQASSLSEASRYEHMSDDELIAMGNRFARGG
jgi:uncharacterized protein YdcH (DUF465 family)